jgi:hypothetical protein
MSKHIMLNTPTTDPTEGNEAPSPTEIVSNDNSKNWAAISALIPGRTRSQCWHRWNRVLGPSIDRTNRIMV